MKAWYGISTNTARELIIKNNYWILHHIQNNIVLINTNSILCHCTYYVYHCIFTSYLGSHFLICGNPLSSTLRVSHQLDHHVVFGNRGITPSRSPNHLEDSVPTSCLARRQCSWPPHPTGNCGNDVLTMCRESNWWILESGELNLVKQKSSLSENYSTVNRTFNDTRKLTWNDAWNSNSILKKSSSKPSCPCVSIRAGCVF